jgi:hypothetical protein
MDGWTDQISNQDKTPSRHDGELDPLTLTPSLPSPACLSALPNVQPQTANRQTPMENETTQQPIPARRSPAPQRTALHGHSLPDRQESPLTCRVVSCRSLASFSLPRMDAALRGLRRLPAHQTKSNETKPHRTAPRRFASLRPFGRGLGRLGGLCGVTVDGHGTGGLRTGTLARVK